MEKGKVSIRDLISLTGPSQRITLYKPQMASAEPEVIYTGYRADLIRQKEIMEAGYIVNHFSYRPGFFIPEDPSTERNEKKKWENIPQEEAEQQNSADIKIGRMAIKIVCDIYIS